MKIKNPQSSLLTNHEVLLHMRSEKADYDNRYGTKLNREVPSGLNAMLRDGLAYLESADHPIIDLASSRPFRPMTLYKGPHSLFRALSPKYRLNKAEYVQIFNLRPTSEVMLGLILEEADTRFSRRQQSDILAIIQSVFEEQESSIPAGVEDIEMPKIKNKLEGAGKKKRRGIKRKVGGRG
ncbi:uncharacterized protein BDR25DRAFT_279570 [Lindgomyces ingoldianus]|uniref:Uncharacterized protein n=1 Tax=Lindgomyces ingoldianus TaxID=673940 RepID=A0ACB6R878_9PLEO|nr:uncharacterized protein BDR25DRAFT_279570 [Lindgomyces ingoldianus]KAF2475483.1 hypothetical protein BDR25DRAFT_279570 [Lindgomyces ingoldianus]